MTQTWRPNWKRLLLYSNYICTELKWPILFRILIWNGTAVCGISNCFRQRQRQFGCPSRGHIHAKEPPPGGPHRTKRTLEYAHSDPNETHTALWHCDRLDCADPHTLECKTEQRDHLWHATTTARTHLTSARRRTKMMRNALPSEKTQTPTYSHTHGARRLNCMRPKTRSVSPPFFSLALG